MPEDDEPKLAEIDTETEKNAEKKKTTKVKEVTLACRVSIMDDYDEVRPEWLNTVNVVVDSEDLPLNFSGETLQRSMTLRVIKNSLVTKCLKRLAQDAVMIDDFRMLYAQFGKFLKFGFHNDFSSCSRVAALLRFLTSKSGDEPIRFMQRVDGMCGEKLKPTTTEGLGLLEEDQKMKLEDLPAEFVSLTRLISAGDESENVIGA